MESIVELVHSPLEMVDPFLEPILELVDPPFVMIAA
jgi:hypothetical protein